MPVFSILAEYCAVLYILDLPSHHPGPAPTSAPKEGSVAVLDRPVRPSPSRRLTLQDPQRIAARLDHLWRVLSMLGFLLFLLYFIIFELNP